jgi:hypothetical protein
MSNFIKVRYRKIGTIEPRPIIDIVGLVRDTTVGISPGSAYALRDALSAALDDYEKGYIP